MYAFLFLMLIEDDTPWLPPEFDVEKFPSGEVAREQVDLYRLHLSWVERMQKIPVLDSRFGRRYWEDAREETIRRLDIWETLLNAKGRGEAFRGWGIPIRASLGALKDKLGEYDYENAIMPPVLPICEYPPMHVERMSRVDVLNGNNN